jgi:hypothetical protein
MQKKMYNLIRASQMLFVKEQNPKEHTWKKEK